jgi:hypothetical protein
MNYCSRTTHESLLYPGTIFVLKKMNERRRVHREMVIAGIRLKVNEGSAAIRAALADAENLPPGTADQLNRVFGVLLHDEWYPAWIRWAFHSIENFEIDDKPATLETLLDQGPTDLLEEIFLAVLKESGISTVEKENLDSPTTSAAPVAGKTNSTTADDATPPAGGESETAPSFIPVT